MVSWRFEKKKKTHTHTQTRHYQNNGTLPLTKQRNSVYTASSKQRNATHQVYAQQQHQKQWSSTYAAAATAKQRRIISKQQHQKQRNVGTAINEIMELHHERIHTPFAAFRSKCGWTNKRVPRRGEHFYITDLR